MRTAAVLVAVSLALAGCGKPGTDATTNTSAAPAKPGKLPPVIEGGWATVFGDAKASLDLFARLGLRPGPYEAKDGRFVSTAVPTPLSDPSQKPAAVANFTASGDAKTLDTVEFAFDSVGNDQTNAKSAFETWVGQAMSRLGVAGADIVLPAIQKETPVSGDVEGAHVAVTKTEIEGGFRLVVTFTSPAAIAANNKTQG